VHLQRSARQLPTGTFSRILHIFPDLLPAFRVPATKDRILPFPSARSLVAGNACRSPYASSSVWRSLRSLINSLPTLSYGEKASLKGSPKHRSDIMKSIICNSPSRKIKKRKKKKKSTNNPQSIVCSAKRAVELSYRNSGARNMGLACYGHGVMWYC
jgi:hypothetical protein